MQIFNHQKFINKGLLFIGLLLLSACSSSNNLADIKAFMADVKARPQAAIAPLPEFEPYQPFTYGASNRRSPFEPPAIIADNAEAKKANIGVKPPKDHSKQYLERFNLATLQMVGTLHQNDSTWALIEDNTGGVHRVQVGDYMGTSWGQIESINESRIDITEIVTDGGTGWLRRPRSIELTAK